MNLVIQFFNAEFIYALGWTILHSFWQCAFVAAGLAVTLRITKKCSSNTRYLMACFALALCCVISCLTFKSYWSIAQQARLDLVLDAFNLQVRQMFNTQRIVQSWFSIMDNYLIWIVVGWFIGCVFMSVRNLLGFMMCLKLQKEGAELVSPHWENTLNRLCKNIGINRKISILISNHSQSPCTLGYFKPLILVPSGLLSGMSQAQVEVVLLHELGHIRRNDYAIGLIQMVVKIIFFFNPMALWISSVIDAERENACDDIAVDACKDPLFFSKTLKEFAELNSAKILAMGINDNNMNLLNRIKRQLQGRKQLSRAIEKLIASFTLLLCCTAATVYAQTNGPADEKQLKERVEAEMVKWQMFSKVPEDQRLAAVKYYLEEFDAEKFSVGISKTVSLESDKYSSEKISASFFSDPLKVKLDISVDLLKAMYKQDRLEITKENLTLLKNDNNNYLIVIDKAGSALANQALEDKLNLVKAAYPKSALMNKFFAKNNLQEYDKPFLTTPADLTFTVTHEYLFVELSFNLIDYALNAPDVDEMRSYDYSKRKLVSGTPFAGAEKAANGGMIITYDRTSWEQKSEWMRENSLFGKSPAKQFDANKELAESISKLDERRRHLLLTDAQLKKVKSCFELNHGVTMPANFTYNLQKAMIVYITQLNNEQLIKTEESHSDHLKKYTMGQEGKEFYVNLLDDSNKTQEDPEGLASCKKIVILKGESKKTS